MDYYFNSYLENYNLKGIRFKTTDNLAIITGNSGIGKSLICGIFENVSQIISSIPKELVKLPDRIFISTPSYYDYDVMMSRIKKTDNSLIVIDDLDGFLDYASLLTRDQKYKLLDSILNSSNKIIVTCKKVPAEFKLPDRFFYNLIIEDGVAHLEQTLKDGLYGVVKNNYVL